MYLKKAKTIVIKIGSSLLINDQKKIRNKWLNEFVKDIENLLKEKKKCSFSKFWGNIFRL